MWQGQGAGERRKDYNQGQGSKIRAIIRAIIRARVRNRDWGRAILRDRVQSQSKWQGQVQGAGVKGKGQMHG